MFVCQVVCGIVQPIDTPRQVVRCSIGNIWPVNNQSCSDITHTHTHTHTEKILRLQGALHKRLGAQLLPRCLSASVGWIR